MVGESKAVVDEVQSLRNYVASLVDSNLKLSTANERLSATVERLQLKVEDLSQRLESTHSSQTARLSPLSGDSEAEVSAVRGYYEAVKAFTEQDEKSHNIVVLGAPERDCEAATTANDDELAKKMLQGCGISQTEFVESFRHGVRRGDRPRTLKLKFRHTGTPRTLLRVMRENKLHSALLPVSSRMRRDLTTVEQIKEREARKEARTRNEVANLYKWRVNDNFELVELASPREWRSSVRVLDEPMGHITSLARRASRMPPAGSNHVVTPELPGSDGESLEDPGRER